MYEDIKQFLGNDVVKVPLKIMAATLPPKSREFLNSVGLPTRSDLLFPFFKRSEEFAIHKFKEQNYLVVAEERGQRLCLDVNTGVVLLIDFRLELPTRFVNSSVISLVRFLKLYDESKRGFQAGSADEADETVAKLRIEFRKEDASALEDVETWWSVILEQTEEGLM